MQPARNMRPSDGKRGAVLPVRSHSSSRREQEQLRIGDVFDLLYPTTEIDIGCIAFSNGTADKDGARDSGKEGISRQPTSGCARDTPSADCHAVVSLMSGRCAESILRDGAQHRAFVGAADEIRRLNSRG